MHSQSGVYALLLGSGVSTGAGVPTGWGVVRELVRRAAAANGDEAPDTDDEVESWWQEQGDGEPLGYSGLLAALASTPAARRALLAGFFEPTEDERERGLKVASPAHRAVAELVRRGIVRVILTTNFDRLTEHALEAIGILPQVIASPSAIAGMEPLVHAKCTIVKLHGDYATLDQLNTLEELSTYATETVDLLTRVLDEYGLVVSGWSGDWDRALVAALESTRSRRYPLFWASYSDLGVAAKRLVAQHRAQVMVGEGADQFFPGLVDRLEALDTLADPPVTKAIAIAQIKRFLPDPAKHIALRDLFEGQIRRLQITLADRPQTPTGNDGEHFAHGHEELRQEADTLLQLLAHGVYLDRGRDHTDLWVWTIQQLIRARRFPTGTFVEWWDNLQHYPALLALRTACMAAVEAGHDDVLIRLLREPTGSNRYTNERSTPAFALLHDYRVLNHDIVNTCPAWRGNKWLYAPSHLLRDTLRPVFVPIAGDDASYEQLCSRTEYRIALTQTIFDGGRAAYRASPGEFIGEWQWTSEDGLIWEADFRSHGDHAAWGWTPAPQGQEDAFSAQLVAMSDDLKKSRRWG
jgi:hypothetical protein